MILRETILGGGEETEEGSGQKGPQDTRKGRPLSAELTLQQKQVAALWPEGYGPSATLLGCA